MTANDSIYDIGWPVPLEVFQDWIARGERGMSSEAIVMALTGESWWAGRYTDRTAHPHDPADFRRCEKLLTEVPLARVAFPVMRNVSPVWAALVDEWDALVALATEEVPDFIGAARQNGGKAPRLFARMRELIDAARKVPA